MNIKELGYKGSKFTSGHRACAGCGFPQIVRTLLNSTDKKVIVANATSCLEVVSTIYPFSSWKTSYIHSAFGNASSTASGIEAAYKVLKKKNKIKEDFKFLAIMGDGGCTDIGLQALSGALERGHDVVFVQYDNEAYQNTGVQRSGATPLSSYSSTTPIGKVHRGKEEMKKDIIKIVAAHNIPYIAQASMSHPEDLSEKARKAFETKGPAFINVIQPCVPGWKIDTGVNIKISRLAVETGAWPLFEIENGKFRLNYNPEKLKPVQEYFKLQGRFKHLNENEIKKIQEIINKEWIYLRKGDFFNAREY